MKRLLITGISGFVGGHFVQYMDNEEKEYEIFGISRSKPNWDFIPNINSIFDNHNFYSLDLMDLPKLSSLIDLIQPDYILHLASQSSVAESWKTPVSSFMNNTNIFLNIIDTVRTMDNGTRILSVGSSEQYGIVSEKDMPLSEERALKPANPYAVARVAQEDLSKIYADGYGLDICCTRSFNHCGFGQSERFVASAIVKQFVRVTKGFQGPEIHIGNGSIIRDFLDVHDVVRAYKLLLEKGVKGSVYNICSGHGHSINDIISQISDIFNIEVSVKEEISNIRPIDNPCIIGNNEKIRRELGWSPVILFEESLKSMYRYWNEKIFTS